MFFSWFLPPYSSKVPYVIYLSLIDLHPPLVDHPDYYLSACLIRHPLQPSVSWGSQGSIVQGSSPHKCCQKVSYRAFNAVATVFPKIFLSFHPFCMFIMHVPITWMLVPSDTLSSRLWVGVVKAALLKSLLHINAARKLATEHSMRWQQLFLKYF